MTDRYRPTIALHFRMTEEFVSRMTWAQIGEILETELRREEDFYEYVDDPASHPVSWSYVADDGNGFRREYTPNTTWPTRCVYIVAIATFEAS